MLEAVEDIMVVGAAVVGLVVLSVFVFPIHYFHVVITDFGWRRGNPGETQ